MPKEVMDEVGGEVAGLPNSVPKHKSQNGSSLSKDVTKESPTPEQFWERRRLSVRDLASKFDKTAVRDAATVEGASKARESNSFDSEAEFQKLRRVLKDLRGRVAGRNKDDVEEALLTMEALSVIYQRREDEFTHEKEECKRLALLLKQTSDDAKAMVEDVRAAAQDEIGKVRAAVQAEIESIKAQKPATAEHTTSHEVEDAALSESESAAPHEPEQLSSNTDKMELEELRREAREARRIKLLHESSNIMDMENQIDGLKKQLSEKEAENVKLSKALAAFKRQQEGEGGKHQVLVLTGQERLGSTLAISPMDEKVPDLALCSIQWYRISADDGATSVISGAIRPQYAPDPFDVGSFLQAEIKFPSGNSQALRSSVPIEPAPGLDKYVESLLSRGGSQFNVRIVLKNGEIVREQSLHTLDMNGTRIKLHKGRSVKAKETYASSMQLCGARGGGDSAAQGLFWVAKKGMTFMLVLESERERNAAIILARKFAKLNDIHLGGPDDPMSMQA